MKFNPIGFKFIGFFLLFTSIFLPSFAYAEARRRSLEELYHLCSQSPFNSRCAGYQVPDLVPLEMQTGIDAGCFLAGGSRFRVGACKVSLVEDNLLVYIESEEAVNSEADRSGTVEIKIPLDGIFLSQNKIHFFRFSQSTESNPNILTTNEPYAFITNEIGFSIEPNAEFDNQTGFITILPRSPLPFGNRITENLERFPQINWNDVSVENSAMTSSIEQIEVNRERLLETGLCVRCNLQGVDLEGVKLEGVNLEGANLKGANLRKSNLKEAYLVGANLEDANLEDTEFNEAILLFASLNRSNLVKANFSGTQLQYAQLSEANLSEAEFVAPANLENTNFENANLSRSRLSGVYLTGANFQGANLESSKLDYQIISFSNPFKNPPEILRPFRVFLSSNTSISFQANFAHVNFRSANLTNAEFNNALSIDVSLRDADLMETELEDAILTILTGADLCGATLPDGSRSQQGCP